VPEALLERYVAEVLRFSKALNLTSVRDAGMFYARFIAPSLAMRSLLPASGKLLDVGSGMGVPGIPLLLTMPGMSGALVERRKKRAEFLRHLKRLLDVRADVYDSDIRDVPALGVDVVVARAVATPAKLLQLCNRHCHSGAVAVLAVPLSAPLAPVSGWMHVTSRHVEVDGNRMLLHKYIKGDVSRET